ncbi:outer membrane lipoprotein chaperone LolA [Aliikangiella sp. G2MR2-5]|uniref:outer membrane lipoprotein chaperone LolA n=1 Tax=Aliikangiella sp. G2MR2-5 TaxID=2788943 RepID=UPI0018A8E296|nr:outer membrane lipoprotein chaperone LolA [Aliikangiella sp. G2MR2-5]
MNRIVQSTITSLITLSVFIISLSILTVSAEEVAQDKIVSQSDTTAAQLLVKKIGGLKTFEAKFEQRVKNENGVEIDFTSGKFSIERPDHFRWEVKESFEQVIVADGEYLYTYDPELEQVTIQLQNHALADSPLLLMTSDAEALADAFDIKLLTLSSAEDGNLFLLKPRKDGNIFSSVHILFKNNEITELLMADSLGQQTSVIFSDIRTNIELPQSLFQFVIPEGVDVIDSREYVE